MIKNINLQFFGQDRIIGQQVVIAFYGPNGPVNFMETDQFTSNRNSSQIKSQPLGQVGERTQDVYGNWEFDAQGAVVDPAYDDIIDSLDQAAKNGQKNLRFRVTETTTYYDGTVKTWVYNDCALYGFKKDNKSAKDAVTWSFKGDSQFREKG